MEQNMNFDLATFMRLSAVICALRGLLGGWAVRGWVAPAVAVLLHRRLGEMRDRMERLVARFRAGRLWRCEGRVAAVVPAGRRSAGVRVWPRGFGWLVRLAGHEAAGLGAQLRAVLAQEEMVALLVAAPQAGRVLAPLCRALGIEGTVLCSGVVVAPVVRVKRVRPDVVRLDTGRVPVPAGAMAWVRRHRPERA
jgi:hypothetical protein